MPDLVIRIKKKTDGAAVLSCVRADGSVTWQRQERHVAAFFPFHDLTHYAVETVLGFRRAFYGLVAEGWDISSFDAPRLTERLPSEALLTELIVGLFDAERTSGVDSDAGEFNWKIDTYLDANQLAPTPFRMTDDVLARIRSRRDELFARWRAVPAGESLELTLAFDSTPAVV
jgi:hypothetical protein